VGYLVALSWAGQAALAWLGLAFKVSAVGVGVAGTSSTGQRNHLSFLGDFQSVKTSLSSRSGDFEMGSKLRRLEALEDPI